MQDLTYRVLNIDKVYESSGLKFILTMLKVIMLMCAHPNPAERPDINWVIIVLRRIVHFLENIYSQGVKSISEKYGP